MARDHTRAAILSIGDELTLGQALDTNSRWLADRLLGLGIVPVEHVTVPDDAAATAHAIRRLAGAADLVISTGGLGPTKDDLTREALGLAMGRKLIEDPGALAQVRAWFERAKRPMPEPNRVQALRPEGAECLPNGAGTAPGLAGSVGSADVYCLPGPPREMTAMFERSILPRLRLAPGREIRTRALHCFGLGESEIAARLGDMMDRGRNPLVGTTASGGVVSCRIRHQSNRAREHAAKGTADPLADTERLIRDRLCPYVFGADGDTLASVILDELKRRGETLAVVESCTGGLLGTLITEVPGSSAAFLGGWITYTNEMKQRDAGVPASIFAAGGPGAVSRECAEAMAMGGCERSGATHCLSITGVAGPDGGSEAKPIGTVWIARGGAGRGDTESRRFFFTGERANIRDWAAKSALAMLRLALIGESKTRLLRQHD